MLIHSPMRLPPPLRRHAHMTQPQTSPSADLVVGEPSSRALPHPQESPVQSPAMLLERAAARGDELPSLARLAADLIATLPPDPRGLADADELFGQLRRLDQAVGRETALRAPLDLLARLRPGYRDASALRLLSTGCRQIAEGRHVMALGTFPSLADLAERMCSGADESRHADFLKPVVDEMVRETTRSGMLDPLTQDGVRALPSLAPWAQRIVLRGLRRAIPAMPDPLLPLARDLAVEALDAPHAANAVRAMGAHLCKGVRQLPPNEAKAYGTFMKGVAEDPNLPVVLKALAEDWRASPIRIVSSARFASLPLPAARAVLSALREAARHEKVVELELEMLNVSANDAAARVLLGALAEGPTEKPEQMCKVALGMLDSVTDPHTQLRIGRPALEGLAVLAPDVRVGLAAFRAGLLDDAESLMRLRRLLEYGARGAACLQVGLQEEGRPAAVPAILRDGDAIVIGGIRVPRRS